MEIENTHIPDLKIIQLKKLNDVRGSFIKVFNEDFFHENGLDTNFKESYFSISEKNVIRGMHFQLPPFAHTKLVYVNRGCIIDVILDMRKNTSTYGQYFTIEIKSNNPVLVYIPKGCAHGFKSLENQTMVTYMQSSVYNQSSDKGVRYDSFGFNWDIEKPILSPRDKSFPNFDDAEFKF